MDCLMLLQYQVSGNYRYDSIRQSECIRCISAQNTNPPVSNSTYLVLISGVIIFTTFVL